MRERSSLIRSAAGSVAEREAFADAVRYYLSLNPRQLPSRYFYDEIGSALFEAICRLPWYPVTRTETRLLEVHAADILRRVDPLSTIVELGPGSGEKLARLLEGGRSRATPMTVHLVDVSAAALEAAGHALAQLEGTVIVPHQTTYEAGLADVADGRPDSGRKLVLFLGSNIGNFDPPGAAAFLASIRSSLAAGDALLVGTDLVKTEQELVRAYDDPLGVTAAFNRNLLARINRELDGDFDLQAFTHRAIWTVAASRVEMHLVSAARQNVHVKASGLEFTMEAGESIWTESSYKYLPHTARRMVAAAGFDVIEQWVDPDRRFALTLASRPA